MIASLHLFLLIWVIFFVTGAFFTVLAWLVYLGWTRFFPPKPEPVYQYDRWKNWDHTNPR